MAENDIIINHACSGESSTEAVAPVVHQVQTATDIPQNLAKELITGLLKIDKRIKKICSDLAFSLGSYFSPQKILFILYGQGIL